MGWSKSGNKQGGASSIEKVSFAVSSNDIIAVSSNPLSASIFTGFVAVGPIEGFTLDAASGSVVNSTGRLINRATGTISIQPVKSGGGGAQVMRLWSETSGDGVSWLINPNSLRTFEIASDGETFKTSISIDVDWIDGDYLRFKCYSVGGGSLSLNPTSDTVETKAVTGPSVIWNLKED